MIHTLKIWPQYFERVADGTKTFEIRKNDRGFQFGDEVCLVEWDPDSETLHDDHFGSSWTKGRYTGKRLMFRIGYVLPIDAERVVLSLLPMVKT